MHYEKKSCVQNHDLTKNVHKETIICPIVEKSIKKLIKDEGYTAYNISKKKISNEEENFMGELYEIDINGQTVCDAMEINIIIKHIIPKDNFINGLASTNIAYTNELFVYNELKNIYDELYKEAGVPENEIFKMVNCYNVSNTHAIILENLNRKKFRTMNQTDVMSIEYAESAIKQLAKFHALSFVLKYKRNDFFEKRIKVLKASLLFDKTNTFTDAWKQFSAKMIDQSFEYVSDDLQYVKESFCDKFYEKFPKYLNGNTSSVKCLCHGDFKLNNILMKEVEGKRIETIIIDYQLLNYGSPIMDILYLIFTGTDREFRKEHLENLKNLYHDTLTKFLKYFEFDVNMIYPRYLYEKDFAEKLDFGLMVSVNVLPCVFNQDQEFTKSVTINRSPSLKPRFKERINGILQDYIAWGLI